MEEPAVPIHRFSREDLVHAEPTELARSRVVRFQDVDAAGVVFFARTLEYFHDAFIELLAERGHDWSTELASGIVAPLKHVEADYLAPLRFGDRLRVELVRAHLEPTQVTVGHRLVRERDSRVAAVGQSVHVAVEAGTFERVEWPIGLARIFERIERRR
jgi:YbgC/YbaW family acyl-CoA thioester hydrolase